MKSCISGWLTNTCVEFALLHDKLEQMKGPQDVPAAKVAVVVEEKDQSKSFYDRELGTSASVSLPSFLLVYTDILFSLSRGDRPCLVDEHISILQIAEFEFPIFQKMMKA